MEIHVKSTQDDGQRHRPQIVDIQVDGRTATWNNHVKGEQISGQMTKQAGEMTDRWMADWPPP